MARSFFATGAESASGQPIQPGLKIGFRARSDGVACRIAEFRDLGKSR